MQSLAATHTEDKVVHPDPYYREHSFADLDPVWIEDSHRKVGVCFLCPHCGKRLEIWFVNPIEGGERISGHSHYWMRSGESLDDLTLCPSVEPKGHFHGHLLHSRLVFIPCPTQ